MEALDFPGHGASSLPRGMLFGDLTLGAATIHDLHVLDPGRLLDHLASASSVELP